ncbi:uncharacterized protein LOC125179243, partial [Hyalella azteca]|uniref:Uncharacterized protein LOC125179243 n=1 Tax=Hyalella azteca TaxID=294128 RepID=A0A979FWC6_HYAAZ
MRPVSSPCPPPWTWPVLNYSPAPSSLLILLSTSSPLPPGDRPMKASIKTRFSHLVAPFLADGIMPDGAYGEAKRSLRREIATRVAATAVNNAVRTTPPPPIAAEEASLPRPYRSALSQLRSGYCSSLASYTHRIDDTTYNALTQDGGKANALLHYFCSKQCNKPASKFLRRLIEMEQEVSRLTEHVGRVDGRVAEIEKGNFTPEMADAVKEITRDQAAANPAGTSLVEVENLIVNKTQELYSEVVERDRKQLVELEERVKRKSNLILFQLAEKKNLDRESRAKEDNEQINRLLAEIKVDHRPLDHRRIGKFTEAVAPQDQKRRPVCLTFSSEAVRDDVLKAYHKIKKSQADANDGDKLCYKLTLRRDLTPQERAEEDKLFEELKSKRARSQASGDERARWIRRNGKVINVGQYPREEDVKSNFNEFIFVDCMVDSGEPLLLGLVYRSPNSTVDNCNALNEMLREATKVNPKRTVILGDFNYPEILWDQEKSSAGQDHPATRFLSACRDAFLVQLQSEPTRSRVGQTPSLIDLVLTSDEDIVCEIQTTAGLGKSDHAVLVIGFNFAVPHISPPPRFNFAKADIVSIVTDLGRVEWGSELSGLNSDATWCKIRDSINSAVNVHVPKTKAGSHNRKKWMD